MARALLTSNGVIEDKYFEDLKTDDISIGDDIIEAAELGDAKAFHDIGCAYSAKITKHTTLYHESPDINKVKAIAWLGISAAMGYFESQLELGHIFKKERPASGKVWYDRALKNGVDSAAVFIGEILYDDKKYEQAKQYFQKSADLGEVRGQYLLGVYYRNGWDDKTRNEYNYQSNRYVKQNCSPDYKAAMEWFLKSAEQGYSEAEYEIGKLYASGHGVEYNYYTALEWYHRSKAGGHEPAVISIKKLQECGYFIVPMELINVKKGGKIYAIPTKDQEPPTYIEATTSKMDNRDTKKIGNQNDFNHQTELSKISNELDVMKNDNPELKNTIEKLEDVITKISSLTITDNKK